MRPGYFKVDETPIHAALIIPGAFVGDTALIELRYWLDYYGFIEPIVYRAATRPVTIPITETGVSA